MLSADAPGAGQRTAASPEDSPSLGLRASYLLEGLNSLGTNVFFLGAFFHARAAHGFSDTENLLLAATQGAGYVAATRAGGRYADRVGPGRSVAAGLAGMCAALLAGWALPQRWALFAAMVAYSAATALTWPALEAAIARSPGRRSLAWRAGLYNVTWALVGAAGFFATGPLFARDPDAVFWIPLAAHALQLAGLAAGGLFRSADAKASGKAGGWCGTGAVPPARERDGGVARRGGRRPDTPLSTAARCGRLHGGFAPSGAAAAAVTPAECGSVAGPPGPSPGARARYLRSAWIANGLAYFLFGAFSGLAPTLGERLGLVPRQAFWLVSVYLFARGAAFLLLWQWEGWTYRRGWLVTALALPPLASAALFAATSAGAAMAALAVLGALAGVAYSASLHASLDREGREGEGGGLHEWVIGLGVLVGPLAGAAGVRLVSGAAGPASVVAALGATAALAGLVQLRRRSSLP